MDPRQFHNHAHTSQLAHSTYGFDQAGEAMRVTTSVPANCRTVLADIADIQEDASTPQPLCIRSTRSSSLISHAVRLLNMITYGL